jgi:hypothetical protein
MGKRANNTVRKAHRAASWATGKRRREERTAEQKSRAADNRALRAEGLRTPWQTARHLRRLRRVERFGSGTWTPEAPDSAESVDRNGGSRR